MLSGHVEGQLLKPCSCTRPGPGGCSRSACSPATRRWRWPRRCPPTAGRRLRARRRRRRVRPGVLRRVAPAGRRIDVRVGPALDDAGRAGRGGRVVRPGLHRRRQGRLRATTSTPCSTAACSRRHGLICVDNTLMQGQPWRPRPTDRQRRRDRGVQRGGRRRPAGRAGALPLRDGLTLIRRAATTRPTGRRSVQHAALDPLGVESPTCDLRDVDDADVDRAAAAAGRARRRRCCRARTSTTTAFLAFLRRVRRADVHRPARRRSTGFPDLNVISNVGRADPAAQHLPRRHQLRRASRRPTPRCGRCEIPERGRRDAVHQPVPRLRDAPGRRCATRLAGRTITPRRHRPRARARTTRPRPSTRCSGAHPVSGPDRALPVDAARCVAISGLADDEARELDRASCTRTPRGRTTPAAPRLGPRRRRDVGQRLRAAPGRPRRRRRRPGDAPRHGRRGARGVSAGTGARARPTAKTLAAPWPCCSRRCRSTCAVTAVALLRSAARPRRRAAVAERPADHADQRRQDDQGAAAGAVVPRAPGTG